MTEREHEDHRPVWHPDVHAHFGESLKFFGITLPSYHDARMWLLNSFQDSASIYEVYGNKDMLVRIYANSQTTTRVKETLSKHVGEIDSSFSVQRSFITHGFQIPHLKPGEIDRISIRDYRRASKDWNSLPDETRQRFLDSNLVIGVATPPTPDSIRGFVFIGTGLPAQFDIVERLVEEIRNTQGVHEYLHGLHTGDGLLGGNIVVELEVPSSHYLEIIRVIRLLHERLKLARPATATYLAGDVTMETPDHCQFVETIQHVMSKWESRFPTMVELELNHRIEIANLCNRWEDLLLSGGCVADLAEAVVAGYVAHRHREGMEQLQDAVVKLGRQTEDFLQRLLGRAAKKRWGKNWEQSMLDALGLEGRGMSQGWTLGQSIRAVEAYAKLEELLDSAAVQGLQQFNPIRDAATHARPRKGRVFRDHPISEIWQAAEHPLNVLAKHKWQP